MVCQKTHPCPYIDGEIDAGVDFLVHTVHVSQSIEAPWLAQQKL